MHSRGQLCLTLRGCVTTMWYVCMSYMFVSECVSVSESVCECECVKERERARSPPTA